MPKNWKTKLIYSDAHAPEAFRSLSIPIYRGSTVLFPNAAAVDQAWDQYEVGFTYGLYGTPTTLELAARICELEKGALSTLITPGGQGAIALINLVFLEAGDHMLVPESIDTPHCKFAENVLRHLLSTNHWSGN
jgi:cysteine-S-conjugate beta-lyase